MIQALLEVEDSEAFQPLPQLASDPLKFLQGLGVIFEPGPQFLQEGINVPQLWSIFIMELYHPLCCFPL